MNEISSYFPFWQQLAPVQREQLLSSSLFRAVPQGTVLHHGSADCDGLFLVKEGRLRAFILSEEGKEITLYRLFDRDLCLFSAACIMNSIQFDVMIEAEAQTDLWVIPAEVYHQLMKESLAAANYTNELMASRFSEVMWLLDQILFKSFDSRLAAFLLEEGAMEESRDLTLTHEKIARHLGTAREVVTRMLKYFQSEGMVTLTRGKVHILNEKKLEALV